MPGFVFLFLVIVFALLVPIYRGHFDGVTTDDGSCLLG